MTKLNFQSIQKDLRPVVLIGLVCTLLMAGTKAQAAEKIFQGYSCVVPLNTSYNPTFKTCLVEARASAIEVCRKASARNCRIVEVDGEATCRNYTKYTNAGVEEGTLCRASAIGDVD